MDKRVLLFSAVMKIRVGAFQEASTLLAYLHGQQPTTMVGLGWAYALTRQGEYAQAYQVLESLDPDTYTTRQHCERLKRRCEKALAV